MEIPESLYKDSNTSSPEAISLVLSTHEGAFSTGNKYSQPNRVMEVWRALWELSSDGKAKAGCRGCKPGQGRVWRAMQDVYIAVLQLWSQEDQFPDPHGAHPWMPWSLKQNGIVQPALCIHGYPESAVCWSRDLYSEEASTGLSYWGEKVLEGGRRRRRKGTMRQVRR